MHHLLDIYKNTGLSAELNTGDPNTTRLLLLQRKSLFPYQQTVQTSNGRVPERNSCDNYEQ